jgi:hypothetical protein
VFFSCYDDDDMPFFLLRPPGAKQQKIIFGFLRTKKVHLSLSLSLSLSLCVSTILCFCPSRKASFVRQNGASELPDLLFLVFSVLQILLFYEVSEGSCRSLGMLFVFLRYGYYYFEHVFFLC